MRNGAARPLVELVAASKVYGAGAAAVRALDRVDLAVEPGEFVAITGASGSGKSTAMNILGCLDRPTSGSYRFAGRPLEKAPREVLALVRRHFLGFVFQGFNLLPRTSAQENVELPLVYRGLPGSERRARAREALARVGLADRANHSVTELSGGQQQRVAIARALVSEPALLLADEPTGNLDSKTSHEIMALLVELNRQGLTIVMVTHEPDIAAYARREVRFKDGRILADERRRAA
ncbi:MAG: macrolide ABC transporter ATP-binding protein [Geminicoccaceae bacterium]|nr:MAG: macrolide ABC transporter ATP-binding protein [Geminicoccaceae bacterium]